jgi:hypothetical protein
MTVLSFFSVGTLSLIPSAAAVKLRGISQMMSFPLRVKVGWGAT